MPCDYSKYPDNWKQIRAAILERAGHKCEWCGVADYALTLRPATGDGYLVYDCDEDVHYDTDGAPVRLSEFPAGYEDSGWSAIHLSITHTNHDTMDCKPENVTALCQHCRKRHDAPAKAIEEAATRQRKHEEATGQLRMFG